MTDVVTATTRRREATRSKLLDAAAQLFAEEGLDAASVEAICERAGFTRGAFYSNFETKDALYLELCGRVAQERIALVRSRVAELESRDAFAPVGGDPMAIVQQILDTTMDDRLGLLLMSEIRINALRNPQLGAAYLAQDVVLSEGVTQIVTDVAQAAGLRFRVPPAEAARLLLTVWESEAIRGVMAGADYAELSRRTGEGLARVAQLIIEEPAD
jgi:AcrR family transcriptional regulator